MASRRLAALVIVGALLATQSADARNFQLRGKNELCGGIGFAGSLNRWTPGGFKWFNDYSRQLSRKVWFNVQFNVVTGGGGGYDCWWDRNGRQHCDYTHNFGGYALEFAAGVKLKWRMRKVPLQIHAKVGGAVNMIFMPEDFTGVAFGFRGGAGVRYFFLPTLGVGAELIPTFGPTIINNEVGMELYAAIDFNAGVEWRF